MSISESRFRVRYAETDQMGVVYYANFLVWMEIGRTDYCRMRGFTYRDMENEEDAFLVVAEASCRYLSPARYDDEILVRTELERLNRRALRFKYAIIHAATGVTLAEGRTTHLTIGSDGKPKSMPQRYLERLRG